MSTDHAGDPAEGPKEPPRSWRVLPGRDERRGRPEDGGQLPTSRKPFSLTIRIGTPCGDDDDDDSEP
jgi:hypothetical protein